jgi:hypothetical protein
MMRELNAAWGSLFQDVMECVPEDRRAEFISRAFKLMQAGEYLAGKEAEAQLNNLTKGETA